MTNRGIMGQLADMADYNPDVDWAPSGDTFAQRFPQDNWTYTPPPTAHEAAAARLARPYARARGEMGQRIGEVAEFLKPETPLDYMLTLGTGGAGLLGKAFLAAPRAVRIGTIAGGALTTADPAEAGISKAAKALMRQTDPAAKFPQYAERYPEIGPPATAIDPKSKQEYLAKQLTPEAVAFQKERDRIIKDMREKGYQPYFDPAQRFHVDPANYPPNVDTTTIVPKKQETIDKHMLKIGGEDARARLRAAYQRGTEMPNTADWYALGQVEQEFVKELGPKEGRKAFQDRIATSMAATTGGADPRSNWLMAAYGNYLRTHGLPYPQAAYEMPFPIGGRYATGNMEQHQKIFDQGGFPALGAANPKRHNFAQDFTGNRAAGTMDEQMTSLMTPGVNMPPPGQYGLYERVLGEEARKVGVQPQNYQDVAWSGAKNLKDPKYTSGQPFINEINESIERTHRLTGMPRAEVFRRGVINGEIPMYALMGMMGMGALADQSSYSR